MRLLPRWPWLLLPVWGRSPVLVPGSLLSMFRSLSMSRSLSSQPGLMLVLRLSMMLHAPEGLLSSWSSVVGCKARCSLTHRGRLSSWPPPCSCAFVARLESSFVRMAMDKNAPYLTSHREFVGVLGWHMRTTGSGVLGLGSAVVQSAS